MNAMNPTTIKCPGCGHEITLSEAIATQWHEHLDAEHQKQLEEAVTKAVRSKETELVSRATALQDLVDQQNQRIAQANATELQLRQQANRLESEQHLVAERTRIETEARLHEETEKVVQERLLAAAVQSKAEKAALQTRLDKSEAAELALRQQESDIKAREQALNLEIERKLAESRQAWESTLRETLTAEQDLKLKEKEKQIETMKRVIDDLKRKSEQGSQETQGEVLEIDIQSALERQFPHDEIHPVPKGMTGADLIQEVRDTSLQPCGSVIWEVKNTKHWQTAWIDKLKDDQRNAGAALAILVSVTLPEGVRGFAQLNGVWVTDLAHYPMLAVALRDQLQQVAFARAAGMGKTEKVEMLYRYLAGEEFRHKIEAIVEAFSAMRNQLDKERRAMTKQWAEREKQIERVVGSTAGMYGALQGIIGQGLAAIPALEIEDMELLEGEE